VQCKFDGVLWAASNEHDLIREREGALGARLIPLVFTASHRRNTDEQNYSISENLAKSAPYLVAAGVREVLQKIAERGVDWKFDLPATTIEARAETELKSQPLYEWSQSCLVLDETAPQLKLAEFKLSANSWALSNRRPMPRERDITAMLRVLGAGYERTGIARYWTGVRIVGTSAPNWPSTPRNT
jgi:hypothetical protein